MSVPQITPAPWKLDKDDLTITSHVGVEICRANDVQDFPCVEPEDEEKVQAECLNNARLVALAPDHADIAWAMCVAAGQWQPRGDGRGEFALNGLLFSTRLDPFGVPEMTESLRMQIAKARGAS